MTPSRATVAKQVLDYRPDETDDLIAIPNRHGDASVEYLLELTARHVARSDMSAEQRTELEYIRKQDREQYLT